MTNEQYLEYLKSEKWKRIAAERIKIDGCKCVICGCTGTARNPLECHHLSYRHIGNEESRIYEDLVTLCQCCHTSVHRMMCRQTSASGRHGWKDNQVIPQLHVFNVDGKITHAKW